MGAHRGESEHLVIDADQRNVPTIDVDEHGFELRQLLERDQSTRCPSAIPLGRRTRDSSILLIQFGPPVCRS